MAWSSTRAKIVDVGVGWVRRQRASIQ